jgi:hypothetical protein
MLLVPPLANFFQEVNDSAGKSGTFSRTNNSVIADNLFCFYFVDARFIRVVHFTVYPPEEQNNKAGIKYNFLKHEVGCFVTNLCGFYVYGLVNSTNFLLMVSDKILYVVN